MTDERRDNVFTPKDRALLQDTNEQVQSINGFVKRHQEEIFGDDGHSTVGLVVRIKFLEELALQGKTAVRVLVGILAIVGVTNVLILFRGG